MATPKKTTPKLKTVEVTAVIPTGDYANVQPKLVYETGSFEEAWAAAKPHLQQIEREVGKDGNNLRDTQSVSLVNREEVTCFASGTKAYFDPIAHNYLTKDGKKYMSGSVFAGQFEQEFNKALLLPKSANRLGISDEECDEYWQSKADISTTFGTALHKSLEHYGRWKDVLEADGKGTGIHPTFEPIVLAFFNQPEVAAETAVYEPFVADEDNLRCGFIDRLVIVDPTQKICIIDDYKTNADLYKRGTPANLKAPYAFLPNVPAAKYSLQLSFYQKILEKHGWTVAALRLWHWAGTEWKKIEVKAQEIDKPQEKIDVSAVI